MEQSTGPHNRRSKRANVLLAATVVSARGELSVRLRNLSAHGALIVADKLPACGEEIVFRRNDIKVNARIAWVIGRHAGIAFDEKLKPEIVLRNVGSLKQLPKPDFRRPAVAGNALSADEQMFIERWLRERR